MNDNLAEMLYMAWRSALLSSAPDLPSWGNVRDPDARGAWEAAADKARSVAHGVARQLIGVGSDCATDTYVTPMSDGTVVVDRVSHHGQCLHRVRSACGCSPITITDRHFPKAG